MNENQFEMSLGTYKHFKGAILNVIAFAKHTETGEWLAIYEYYKDGIKHQNTYARPVSMWNDKKEWNGELVPRFTKIDDKKWCY